MPSASIGKPTSTDLWAISSSSAAEGSRAKRRRPSCTRYSTAAPNDTLNALYDSIIMPTWIVRMRLACSAGMRGTTFDGK